MESNLSCLSSLKEDNNPLYIQPHYKESYRLAIYALLCGGKEAYEEFLRAERIGHFLSEEEILYVFQNAELPFTDDSAEGKQVEDGAGASTYFPTESDEEVPDLDLGWPEVLLGSEDTSISLLFNPPRQNTPTIKEVVRKQIQGARQVIAIAMDVFTDLDIFKETVTAALRGVMVYILLDDSQFKSFLTMSQRVGVNVQDFKNIRVRTVRGQQYQCQSGVKFRGDLEQRFLLVDCRTVLYGTYSYTWSFEKINVSMVLVITGQLVGSYDEEFRRLYARSTVPTILSRENSSVQHLRDIVALQSPNSSHLSLHQLHTQTKVTHGTWGVRADRFSNAAAMTRGMSVQEKLHQSHCFDTGNLMRGHSYGGELQKLSPMTRLRMGTKNTGMPINPEKTRPNPRGAGDLLPPNRSSQHHLRHQNRYGADQSLIPFNSETSLNRWKMDAYFNDSGAPLDASCDTMSSIISPYGSHAGLNEHQTPLMHNRSMDIKSMLEEVRQKRLSLQDCTNLRHSQESLRSAYQEKTKYQRDSDKKKVVADSEPNAQNSNSTDPADKKDSERKKVVDKREQTLPIGQRSASHCDGAVGPDRKTMQTYDWHKPPSRADVTQNDPMLKVSHLQHPRTRKSLTEIPEEKGEGLPVKSSVLAVLQEGHEVVCKEEKSVESSITAKSQLKDPGGGGLDFKSSGTAPRERKKSTSNEVQTVPKILNPLAGSQPSVADKSGQVEKKKVSGQEPLLQRKHSLRTKVSSMLSQDEKKVHKKQEKSLQRKSSMRSHAACAEQPAEGGHLPRLSRSQSSLGGPAEAERQKSPFPRLTPQRSSGQASKRKPSPSRGRQRGLKSPPGDEAADDFGKQKVYSRFEHLLSSDGLPPQSEGRSSPNRQDSHQSGADNKLGRFMQRVGNLIGKNK